MLLSKAGGYACEAYKWTLGAVPERSVHVGSIQNRTLCFLRRVFVCMCQFLDVLQQVRFLLKWPFSIKVALIGRNPKLTPLKTAMRQTSSSKFAAWFF